MQTMRAYINATPHPTGTSSTHLSFHFVITLCTIRVTLMPLTAACYKTMTPACLHLHPFPQPFRNRRPTLHKATTLCDGESVKMAVLIRWRIRAVILFFVF